MKAKKKVKNKIPQKVAIPKKKKMRKDKESHLIEIDDYVTRCIRDRGRIPHQTEIARAVGLNRKTVGELLGEISLTEIARTHVSRLKTSDFIAAMYLKGVGGNTAAAKIWLQIIHNWVEKYHVDGGENPGATDEVLNKIADAMQVK
jgi:hypothetical protein